MPRVLEFGFGAIFGIDASGPLMSLLLHIRRLSLFSDMGALYISKLVQLENAKYPLYQIKNKHANTGVCFHMEFSVTSTKFL